MSNAGKKTLMIVDKQFPGDPRVAREAYKLASAGYKVRVISLSSEDRAGRTLVRGIPVYYMPLLELFHKSARPVSRLGVIVSRVTSKVSYVMEYLYLLTLCSLLIPYVAVRDGFDVIHIHNPPNVLCVMAMAYKLFGKKVVFDHHDLEPELYVSRYRIPKNRMYRILLGIEAYSIRHADMVIATNESYRNIEIERGAISPEKIFIVRNGPEIGESRLPLETPPRADGKIKLVYVGVMGPQDGIDYMLRALHHLRYALGRADFFCVAVGPGDTIKDMKAYAHELGLDDHVEFTGFIPKKDLLAHLATADICLDPNPSNPLNDHSTWIKVMEYMAFAKPIVSFSLTETRFSAREAAAYVTPNDTEEYARVVAALMDDPARRARMGRFGASRVANHLAWDIVSENLLRAYEWLFTSQSPGFLWSLMRRLYFTVKPVFPRSLQIAARRRFVHAKLPHVREIWPIDPASARRPTGWTGWPSSKRFALVITHDVENARGMDRCLMLSEIEKARGVKSSYNFVPGRYLGESGIREQLVRDGFEIGVHDLWHDGKLYSSRAVFMERAQKINQYLGAWGAVGFRSGSMQHNLEWISDLDIEYDSSTFDTDPFEPQPDGVGTIFPMLVRGSCGRQYVELPYTLPQDITVFIMLKQDSPALWERKLDWIAEHGGMALLNTHPDYMKMDGGQRQVDEYPFKLYADFLDFVAKKYQGQYWNALPREIARYWLDQMGTPSRSEPTEA
jgi:glycosyltransferase involved in cell wall biosynthesis